MFVTPGVVVDGKLVTTDLVDINLGIRILLGSSYYDDWQQERPLSRTILSVIPWISGTPGIKPQRRVRRSANSRKNTAWVMSPRWYDKRTGDYLALDTGGGPLARFWATALAGLVDFGYVKATGHSVKIYLAENTIPARGGIRVEDSSVEQCD